MSFFLQGIGIEIILTTFVSYTIHTVVDTNRPELGGSGPLSIGLAVTLAHLIGVGFVEFGSLAINAYFPMFLIVKTLSDF